MTRSLHHKILFIFYLGYQKKRKIVDIACSVSETQQEYSVGCVGCNEKRCVWQFRRHPDYKNGQMNVFGVDTATSCAVVAKIKGNTGEPQTSCDQVTAKPRKRSRPFRWQRHRKCRHIELQEFSDKKACTIPCDDKNSSCGKHLYDNNRVSHFHNKMISLEDLRNNLILVYQYLFHNFSCCMVYKLFCNYDFSADARKMLLLFDVTSSSVCH